MLITCKVAARCVPVTCWLLWCSMWCNVLQVQTEVLHTHYCQDAGRAVSEAVLSALVAEGTRQRVPDETAALEELSVASSPQSVLEVEALLHWADAAVAGVTPPTAGGPSAETDELEGRGTV